MALGFGEAWIPPFRILQAFRIPQGEGFSSGGDQRTASLTPRYWPAFSLLQPVGLSLQAPIGRLALETRMTGAIDAGYIEQEAAGPAPAQAPQTASVPNGLAPVEVSARAAVGAPMSRPVQSSGAAGGDNAHSAMPGTRVAYAIPPNENDLDRGGTGRKSPVDLGPAIVIGHTLQDHEGGDVEEFAAKYERIRKSGRRVEIDGQCVSACTIVASLPKDQVCVTPRASLGVHLASDADDDRIDPQYTDWAVKTYYPRALQDWIKTHGGLQEEPKFVKGRDLLAIFDACKEGA
jgi:hypothetical protein